MTKQPPEALGPAHVPVGHDEDAVPDAGARRRLRKRSRFRQGVAAACSRRRREIRVDIEEAGSWDMSLEVELAATPRIPELPATVDELVAQSGRKLRGFCLRRRVAVHLPDQVAVTLGAITARNRDVELGVAPHAVLGYVEARRLHVLLDADPPQPLHRPETAERRRERERTDGEQSEHLPPELMERAGVDEAAATGVEIRCERGDREQTGGERAPDS